MARPKTPRLGRPPASSANETRHRILEVASDLFAANGYGVTTNKDVAEKAGITTGALYYYFDSKLDMYMAVFQEQQAKVDERFNAILTTESTFDGRLRAILEAAYVMNVEDPSIAQFQGTARVDRLRHPELAAAIPNPPGEGASLVGDLIADGIASGEVDPARRDEVTAVVRTLFVGLVDGMSQNPADQRHAIDGIHALLDGTLVNRPKRVAARRRAV
jgi:AcrR family transcriptional regulator